MIPPTTNKNKFKQKWTKIKLRFRKNKTHEVDDQVTIVVRSSYDSCVKCMGEKLPLDELTDISTQIHPQQTSPFKEKMILETAKHIENKQEKLDQTVELLCSVVSSPRHPQPQYQIQPQPQPQLQHQQLPSYPPPKYQPRSIPPTIKYKSQLNQYLLDKASDPKPYTSISSYYMNLHNSFANYYLIVQDGSYQCVNYKLLEPEIEDSSRLLKSHYRFFYGFFVLYISIFVIYIYVVTTQAL